MVLAVAIIIGFCLGYCSKWLSVKLKNKNRKKK